jgi:hypothetical protein
MLIRVTARFHKQNSHGIDEMICIKGLPDDLMFRHKEGRTYLRFPWEMDIDANIPIHIRELCDPMDISEDMPHEKNEVTGQWQNPTDTRRVLGVKISLDHTPGTEMWRQVERILEHETPRDRKLPTPVKVAPDQKSPFALELKDIPVVILRAALVIVSDTKTVAEEPPVIIKTETKIPFQCAVCSKTFSELRGLLMHGRRMRHKAPEPVAA